MKLAQEYRYQWNFIKKDLIKTFIIICISFFAVFILTHFMIKMLLSNNPYYANRIVLLLQELMGNIVADKGSRIMAVSLFFNNARAVFIMIALGIIPFLFLPTIAWFYNAILIGVVTGLTSNLGMSNMFLTAGLLPHGIFEFPAMFLGAVLGYYLCIELTKKTIGKSKKLLSTIFMDVLKCYVLVILPLLVVAAVVEAYITPFVMSLFV